jgi:biopolymer transport protein ExbB
MTPFAMPYLAFISFEGWTALDYVGNFTYILLFFAAVWGLYCASVIWTRVGQKRFRSEAEQDAFLDQVLEPVRNGDFNAAQSMCQSDPRAVPQLISMALENRSIGYSKVRQLVVDRFQRDVLSDLEHRMAWVVTMIKTAPMLGLFGTVAGMMGAFSKLASAEQVAANKLAGDINVALVTTACGLAIAIPLIMIVSAVNIRIRKMEDLVAGGLGRFLEALKGSLPATGSRRAG